MRKLLYVLLFILPITANAIVRLKDISRIDGVRENDLAGYGIVVGLAGTGDTARSDATMQSVMNTLRRFDVNVPLEEIRSRNVAVVIVTAKLKAFNEIGDKIDVSVSSMGDASSLVGGTLLMTPLKAANDKIYGLAQGQVSIGGYKFDLNGNMLQKNHPTVGLIPQGGTVEADSFTELTKSDGTLNVIINDPDFTTASRIADSINNNLNGQYATAVTPGKIRLKIPPAYTNSIVGLVTHIESIKVDPDKVARVVINERTGTVVAGGDVTIDNITISHGNIKINISTEYDVSQPSSFQFRPSRNIETVVVPDTQISVKENESKAVELSEGATIGDLVSSLREIKTSTRDIISILQSINTAGALHAQLIIQ